MKIQMVIITSILIHTTLLATSIADYIDTSKCGKIIDKQFNHLI